MQLSELDLLNGASATLIFFVTIAIGVIILLTYRKEPSNEKLVTIGAILSMGLSWFGVVGSFTSILLTGSPLNYILHIWLQGWAPLTGGVFWTYLTFTLVKPEWSVRATGIVLLLLIINLFLVYILLPVAPIQEQAGFITIGDIATYDVSQGGLPDTSYKGLFLILVLIVILELILLVAPAFLWYAGLKADDRTVNAKGRLVGIGVLFFGIFSVVDALLEPTALVLLIARLFVIFSLILVFLGFAMPPWLVDIVVREKSSQKVYQ